jgi:uncharacterized membrane protein
MHKVHAIFTGFPLAILLALILFEIFSRFKSNLFNKNINICRFFLLAIFLIFTLITFITGYVADWYLPKFSESALITFSNHYFYAKLILFVSLLPLFLSLIKYHTKKTNNTTLEIAYFLSLIFCITIILIIGYFGGELIFTHGIGVVKQF